MDAQAVGIFFVFNDFRLHHAQRTAQVEFFGDDLSDGGQFHTARTVFAADSPSVGIILRVGTVADIEAFDLVGGQCGAEAVVQPTAFHAGFVLAGVFGIGVEHGGRRSVDAQIAVASAIRCEAFVIRGVERVGRRYVPHCADVGAERMAAVLTAAAGEFVFGIKGVFVVTAAEDEFQVGRGGEDVLHKDAVGVGFVAVLGEDGLQPARSRPACAVVGVDGGCKGAAETQCRVAVFAAVVHAYGQVVFKTPNVVVAIEREVGRQGFVVGLLPGVVALDADAVFAACIEMVEILRRRTVGELPLGTPFVVEGVFKIGTPDLQLVFDKIVRVGKTHAVRQSEAVVHGLGRAAVGRALHIVVGVLPRPFQAVVEFDGNAGRNHDVFAVYAAAERIGAPDFAGEADGDVFVQHFVDVHIQAAVCPRAVNRTDVAALFEVGVFADHVDDAAAVGAAVKDGRRAFQDFHALDVGGAAAHLSAFAHAVAVNIGCIGLEAAQENAFAAHIVGSVNTGVAFEDGTQIVRAVIFVFLDIERINGLRRFFDELSVAGNGGFVVIDVAFEYAGVGLSDHGNGGQGGGVMFTIILRIGGSNREGSDNQRG